MLWKEVIGLYGEEMADKMKGSKYIVSVCYSNGKKISEDVPVEDVIELMKNGKVLYDFDEKEIDNAYREATGLKVH